MNRKERAQEMLEYLESVKDEEGFAVVDVNITEETELYDPLSLKGHKDLNGEIYDYIDAQTNVIPSAVPLRIRFHGQIGEEEQKEIRQMMHRHYTMRSYDNAWDLAANFRKMLLLAIFGAVVLAIYLYFAITEAHVFMTEILSIVGSFALWEAADALLLERPDLRREHRNIEQSLNQKIEFME